jgi:hypothetical protein
VSVIAIVVIVLVALLLVLIVGGLIANARHRKADEDELRAELEAANQALATAHAQDKGWDRGLLEQAAKEAFAERSAADVTDLHLVQVVDRPGTDDDQAVFRVVTDHGYEYLHLARHGGAWMPQ